MPGRGHTPSPVLHGFGAAGAWSLVPLCLNLQAPARRKTGPAALVEELGRVSSLESRSSCLREADESGDRARSHTSPCNLALPVPGGGEPYCGTLSSTAETGTAD